MSGLGLVGIEVTVEIDLSGTAYGGSPTWTDVTADVLTADGNPIGITWGRQDWISDATPATCSFTLDNYDGRYTPGLTSSPYYPNVRHGARCRVRADVTVPAGGLTFTDNGDGTDNMTGPSGFRAVRADGNFLMLKGGFEDGPSAGTLTYTGSSVVRTVYLFDGPIDSFSAMFENGVYGLCAVSATDVLGRYGSDQPLRAMLYEEILTDSPSLVYPFNDAGPSFGDLTGTFPPLFGVVGSGAPDIAYQNVTGCADQAVTGVGLGGYFSGISGVGFGLSGGGAAGLFFSTAFTGAACVLINDVVDSVNIGITAAGYISDGTSTGVFVADGQVHLLVVVNGVGWYLDGVLYGTASVGQVTSLGFNLVGTLWCFATYLSGVPSPARFAEQLQCARTNFAGESTDQHMARLLTYRTTFGSVLDSGRGRVGPHATDSESLQQALYDTAEAEGGIVYADGQARIVMLNRAHLFSPSVDLVLDSTAGAVQASTEFVDDIEYVVNKMSVTGPSGSAQVFKDDTSIGADGVAEQDLTLIVDTDAAAMGRAKWEVQVGVQEQVATPTLDIDLFTVADPNTVLAVLQTRPFDVVNLTGLPATTPTVEEFMVQGGSLSIAVDQFLASLVTTVVPAGGPY